MISQAKRVFELLTPARLREVIGPLLVEMRTVQGPLELASRGFAVLDVLAPEAAAACAAAIERLVAAGAPPTALYALEEPWAVGEGIRAAASAALGGPYELVSDFWAFHVRPGQRGWPAHRGVYDRLDRTAPEWINVWLALSDVEADRAAMHLVPLDDDPAYLRGDLDAVTEAGGAPVPLRRGQALAWNANLLHWGGPCAATAAGPRISMTFTLRRGGPALAPASPWARLDRLAEQIRVYGDTDPCITPEHRAWAETTLALTARL